jgi:hypothetical protein
VRKLSGLLPICAYCKRVRDDHDYWLQIEQFVSARSEARFRPRHLSGLCRKTIGEW